MTTELLALLARGHPNFLMSKFLVENLRSMIKESTPLLNEDKFDVEQIEWCPFLLEIELIKRGGLFDKSVNQKVKPAGDNRPF